MDNRRLGGIAATATIAMVLAQAANAASLRPVYAFNPGGDGADPEAALIYQNGLLYGTAYSGGAANQGAVFQVDPATGAEKVIYSFAGAAADGAHPLAAVIYQNGYLYGTTVEGGPGACNNVGCGTVFKLDPASGAETVLHTFALNGADGYAPGAALYSLAGTLYGTTIYGGSGTSAEGTLYKLDPTSGTETILHTFGNNTDGKNPFGALLYHAGAFYGTTYTGGGTGCNAGMGYGVIFTLDPGTGSEQVVYRFQGSNDGTEPEGGLIYDGTRMYGTTLFGGAGAWGNVYAFDPATGTETVLYTFTGAPDAAVPHGELVLDNNILYGTTTFGGPKGCRRAGCGAVFGVNAQTGAETVLAPLKRAAFGSHPDAGLVRHGVTLYGTATAGGLGGGTVFKFKP